MRAVFQGSTRENRRGDEEAVMVRSRKEIEADGARKDILALEVLLDIRQLLQEIKRKKRKAKEESKK